MKVIITGATGMVGKGILLECLDDPRIDAVLVLGRSSVALHHEKLTEILIPDFFNLAAYANDFVGYDACFFSLGVSSMGMSEEDYTRYTYDLTLHLANTLLAINSTMVFCYVSALGANSSEKGRSMWARVRGKTENALLSLAFKKTYIFRLGFVAPKRGVKSRVRLYNIFYSVLCPLMPLLKKICPNRLTTTECVGKAMINLASGARADRILYTAAINKVC